MLQFEIIVTLLRGWAFAAGRSAQTAIPRIVLALIATQFVTAESTKNLVTLLPAALSFPNGSVGSTSQVETVTLTNSGNSNVNDIKITITGDFTQTNNCPGTLSKDVSCAILIRFAPNALGARIGTLTALTSGSGSRLTVNLTGTGVITINGTMTNARYGHTATLLNDGRVLIAGGWNGSAPTATADLFDPTTGTFTATGSMNAPRNLHTATLLNDGTVLIAGGFGNVSLASAEVYDPASGKFSLVGAMAIGRGLHTATLLNNGKVLMAGGKDFSTQALLSSAELYDPVAQIFTQPGDMLYFRLWHAASLLNTGKVLVVGGVGGVPPFNNNNSGSALSSAELFDPATGTFSATGNMNFARALFTATPLISGRILVAAGTTGFPMLSSAELYDPVSGSFLVTGSLITGREFHRATLLAGGSVLVTGGDNGPSNPGPNMLSSEELYDPGSESFSSAGMMVSKREGHTATLLQDGQVLITGGTPDQGFTFLATAELF